MRDTTNTCEFELQEAAGGYAQSFKAMLHEAIEQSTQEESQGALVSLRVKNLPMIIRAAGIETSEKVMRMVFTQLSSIIGEGDRIVRSQRDEFGIIINQCGPEEAEYLAERLLGAARSISLNPAVSSIHCHCSLSIIHFPLQASSADEALSMAWLTTHDVGAAENTILTYEASEEVAAYNRQEMSLANYLHKAIEEERLLLAWQPIIQSKDGSVAHVEALLRVRSDDGKISSAGPLIPIAERMGLIDIIDERVLKMVVEKLRNTPDVQIAFNVSNLTTHNAKWMEVFSGLMNETPEIAKRLIVEITETAAQLDLQHTAVFVAEIQSFGCQVALDDFGSGYTSFRQLKTLSVDMVKIDGSFIKDLVDSADNRFFVKTLLDFTNAFGLRSVAEYVENGEIAKMLMELGVGMLQGYYFGMPDTDLEAVFTPSDT